MKNTSKNLMFKAAQAANRKPIPPNRVEADRKKENNKRACRGKVKF